MLNMRWMGNAAQCVLLSCYNQQTSKWEHSLQECGWDLDSAAPLQAQYCADSGSEQHNQHKISAPSWGVGGVTFLQWKRVKVGSDPVAFTSAAVNVPIDSIIPYILKMETADYNSQMTGPAV
ncbi:Nuclear receptor subfamily 2 group C member 2 [Anabarilius grahami]|uniref:Nuclear receptor subfamily 2 group C member 2 n=1 Tax=Anabarilius grahami TaxID=495550 RepID=A0A3N0XP43_ANAGA|nr:Nuclear receptor subfamily 2 group C member 2 [Anabarilius grahami]